MNKPRKPRLTRQLIDELAARIKAGAFERVAVESLGILWEDYQRWLKRGEKPNAPALFLALFGAIRQARAHARLMAEIQMRTDNSRVWLVHGPGKETDSLPGWTAPVKANVPQSRKPGQEDTPPELLQLCSLILEVLSPFPEARKAVAEVLTQQAEPKGK
jgi:hypothetical protein